MHDTCLFSWSVPVPNILVIILTREQMKKTKILDLAKKEPSLAHAIISMNVSLVRLYLRIIFPPIVLRNPIKINHLLPTSQPEPQIQL